MAYAADFYALQWRFAERIAAVSDTRVEDQIDTFTALPTLLGLSTNGRGPHRFFARLATSSNLGVLCREAHRSQEARLTSGPGRHQFGCFHYVYPWRSTKKLRLHFANADESMHPLTSARTATRRAELRDLIGDVDAKGLRVEKIRGGSWLYNLEAYRRLFPNPFVADLRPLPPEPAFLSQWGQFVHGDGTIRVDLADALLTTLDRAESPAQCLQAFPYRVLKAECGYAAFREGVYGA